LAAFFFFAFCLPDRTRGRYGTRGGQHNHVAALARHQVE
jgi:hypothetical protein